MKRQNGYYWVRHFMEWMVAQWKGEYWHIPFEEDCKDDIYFNEINETRIVSPDELVTIDQSTKDDSPTSPLDLSQEIEDFVTANPVLHSIFFKHYRANE